MKFYLDTDKMEEMKLTISVDNYDDDRIAVFNDFCFGIAAFYSDFAMKIGCNTELAKKLKKPFFSCIDNNIDTILEEGVLEAAEEK